jgi:hypothetical protein
MKSMKRLSPNFKVHIFQAQVEAVIQPFRFALFLFGRRPNFFMAFMLFMVIVLFFIFD